MKDNKNFNVLLDDFVKNKYVDTGFRGGKIPENVNAEKIQKDLMMHILNSNYGIKVNNYARDLNVVLKILEIIKECDETSATKCYTCINEIKNLINERLLKIKESEDIKHDK